MGVILFELPDFNTKNEFMSFIKDGLGAGYSRKRFNIIKDNQHYFDGRGDYCAFQHRVVEDKEAVKRSNNKGTMILEMIDYICRLPRNKNVGIAFDYSHRYYPGHQDKSLTKSAREAFNLLKF
jgi:hypothetical protein